MRELYRTGDVAQAEADASLLRSAGVAAYVRELRSLPRSGATLVALHVILDHQFADAKALLEDETHQVEHPLAPEEMARLPLHALRSMIVPLLGVLALLVAIVALVLWRTFAGH